jgi:hypothetical protein
MPTMPTALYGAVVVAGPLGLVLLQLARESRQTPPPHRLLGLVSPRVLLGLLIEVIVVVLLIRYSTSRHGGTMDGIWWVYLPVPVFVIAINLKELLVTWRSRRPQPAPSSLATPPDQPA